MSKSTDKFYPTDNVNLDMRTSCTKEEAAAKLIGWMRGHIRHDYPVDVDEDEITTDNLVYTHSLVYSLQEHLTILRNAEWNRYNEAVCDGLSEDVLVEKAHALAECDDLIRKVSVYLCDIDEELDKEFDQAGSSILRIDRQSTADSGKLHVTINSLKKWAKDKYGISIFDDEEPKPEVRAPCQIAQQNEELDISEDMSKIKANRFLVTFAFLVDAYADTAPRYHHEDGRPNVDGIIKRLVELSTAANRNVELKGMSAKSIQTLITEAKKIQRSMLPAK